MQKWGYPGDPSCTPNGTERGSRLSSPESTVCPADSSSTCQGGRPEEGMTAAIFIWWQRGDSCCGPARRDSVTPRLSSSLSVQTEIQQGYSYRCKLPPPALGTPTRDYSKLVGSSWGTFLKLIFLQIKCVELLTISTVVRILGFTGENWFLWPSKGTPPSTNQREVKESGAIFKQPHIGGFQHFMPQWL